MSLQSQVDLARRRAASQAAEWEQQRQVLEQAHHERMALFNRDIRPRLRRATARDYSQWVRGYLERGGTIRHAYDYGLPSSFYVATTTINDLPALFGAESVSIIVPMGITVTYTDRGHNELFLVDGFDHTTTFGPPVYTDTVVD